MHVITLLLYSLLSIVCAVVGKEGVTATPVSVTASTACNTNNEIQTCFVCAQLPFGLRLSSQDCCTDTIAFEICKNCIADPMKCLSEYIALVNGENPFEDEKSDASDDQNDSLENVKKRFGRLFLGQRPLSRPVIYELPVTEKKNSILELPERYGSDANMFKRWGTLNMGTRYGSFNLGKLWKHYNWPDKRNGVLNDKLGMYDSKTDGHKTEDTYGPEYREHSNKKRFSMLDLGKRYGTLFFGKWFPDFKKRYGTLHLGNGYGLSNQYKPYGMSYLKNRWGTLGLGNTHRYFPTKRNNVLANDLKKRYGRLFL